MTNVTHASLTGSDVHEPKGITTAALGTAYVANGSGSGSWSNIGTSTFTGMIADFVAPIAPSGWLELDGSIINTTTFAGLYAVMTMTVTGTRTNSSPTVTSIADTSQFRVGYFAYGTGIISGTTIVSIDSATQITLSNNCTSSGTATFAISPWLLNNGTITLPDLTTSGRYRRSRTSTTKVGDVQSSTNIAHTHTLTNITGSTSTIGDHSHGVTDPGHTHTIQLIANIGNFPLAAAGSATGSGTPATSNNATGISVNNAGSHAHTATVSGTSDSTGTTESRPITLIVLTCVKT